MRTRSAAILVLDDYVRVLQCTDRLHFSLDTNNCQMPLMELRDKGETDETGREDPNRMVARINGGGQDWVRHDYRITFAWKV